MRCPRCGSDKTRLLAALNPSVVLECPRCGEVWKAEEDIGLVRFRVLCELVAERSNHWGE